MTDFIILLVAFFRSILNLFSRWTFNFLGYEVSYLAIIFGFMFIGFVSSIYWKGAKT